ncbi:TIGR01440 family protein [Halobacillus sp. A5]|uniref:TIGR01440 family protein n=1 Tax=Halobacillus sp. A5 TaxID=2880263 RepID=UPI0035327CD7
MKAIQQDAANVARQLLETGHMRDGLFVVGCSTSEVAGESIGTSGSEAIAEVLFEEWRKFSRQSGADLAFQCCEHLNRSLVVEREVQKKYGCTEVAAVPVSHAGGSMASYAFKHMDDPVLVESVQAQGGVDIGDTLIGMHLKRVAVPLRIDQKSIGYAHVSAARTRPPLVGGPRAVYER